MNEETSSESTNSPSGPLKTSLSRGWVIKSLLVVLVFVGLGIWGLVDATYLYPKRGQNVINHAEAGYLEVTTKGGTRRSRDISIEDPAARLQSLQEAVDLASKQQSDRNFAGTPRSLTSAENATYQWLTALDRLENMEALTRQNEEELARRKAGEEPRDTKTLFVDPVQHLNDLKENELKEAPQPKPLKKFDLPLQWLFVVIGWGVGIPLLGMFLINAAKSYRYDPASRTLTMPGGTTVTPETLTGFDKRKWDKFLLFITLQGETQERKVDLYRYNELEDWLVEIYEHSAIYEDEPDFAEPESAEEMLDDSHESAQEDPADTAREGDGG